MSGIINYIISWFKGTKTDEPNDKLTVKGIQQDAKKQNIDNIKPFNYEESTELNLDQMMLNDSMKSDFNDLSLNTAIDSSVNEKETESGTFANDLWFIVRGKDRKTSEKLLEYWHFICENSEWKCIERKKKG